jgi:crossover junction endodeoxyribonuclease RuvC
MIVLGIDPGVAGAIAMYDGKTLFVTDFPTITFRGTKKNKTRIVLSELADLFNIQLSGADHAYYEDVGAMPGNGGVSMFNFGYAAGLPTMCAVMCGIPITSVSPTKWKGDMGLNREAEKSRSRALQLFPNHVDYFKLKKDHNRAEAALIAWYGYQMLTVGRVR